MGSSKTVLTCNKGGENPQAGSVYTVQSNLKSSLFADESAYVSASDQPTITWDIRKEATTSKITMKNRFTTSLAIN